MPTTSSPSLGVQDEHALAGPLGGGGRLASTVATTDDGDVDLGPQQLDVPDPSVSSSGRVPRSPGAAAGRRGDGARPPAPAVPVPGTSGRRRCRRPGPGSCRSRRPGTACRRPTASSRRAGSRPRRESPAANAIGRPSTTMRPTSAVAPGAGRRSAQESRRSLAHPPAGRVEQRLGLEPGRPAPADDLDLEPAAAGAVGGRERGRHVAERDRRLHVSGRSRPT